MRHDSLLRAAAERATPEFSQKIYELGWLEEGRGRRGTERSCNDTERMNKKTDCLRTLFVPRSSS